MGQLRVPPHPLETVPWHEFGTQVLGTHGADVSTSMGTVVVYVPPPVQPALAMVIVNTPGVAGVLKSAQTLT